MQTCWMLVPARRAAAEPAGSCGFSMSARHLVTAMLALALLGGCTTVPEVNEGKRLIASGRIDEGLALLEKAARSNPRNSEVRSAYVMQKEALVNALLRDGDSLRNAGDLDTAEARYRRAQQLDPSARHAQAGMEAVTRDRRHAVAVRGAEEAVKRTDFDAAERLAREVLAENSTQRGARAVIKTVAEHAARSRVSEPRLKADLQRPISLEFRDAPIHSVFELISRTAGINFVFDRDVRQDLRTTIFTRETRLDDVIRLLLLTNQLEHKVINDNSVLIYPNTQPKQREYQELVVRTFYLANADPKQTAAMIRALVKTRDLYVDEKLNLIVMKDTADAVRLAEKLVATQDLSEPEVMLELEVLEVASSVVQEFGIRYPDQVNFGLLGGDSQQNINVTGNVTTITETPGTPPPLVELRSGDWRGFVSNPVLIFNMRKLDGTASLLANPRIRVKNRDKAKVHIGERVPVITTTSTANVGVSSSVSYLETGLKLDVEPNIHLEDEVAIKVQLEVSNILEQLNIGGTVSYRLGTRNASTALRLRDGETQVLAGLINSEDRKAAAKVPYLGDFPLLGRLFRSDSEQRAKTEIVLLITPRIVRNLARPDSASAQFSSGTDVAPGAAPLRLAATSSQGLRLLPGSVPAAAAPQVPPVTAAAAATAAAVALLVSAPQQAALGSDFAVSVRLAPGQQSARASVELAYDTAVLAPVQAGAAAGSGRISLDVVATGIAGIEPTAAQVRFRVIGKVATVTEIGLQASAVDNAGRPVNVRVPESHSVEIVQ